MRSRILAVIMFCLLASGCAKQQVVQPTDLADKMDAEALKLPDITLKTDLKEEKKPRPSASEKKPDEQYIMLNFENADIETVISTIGEMLKINYIVAPGVSGKITIQSYTKVPVSELFSTFQTILEFNGFTAVKYGSFYRIVPIDQAKQQPVPIEAGKLQVASKDSSFVTQQIPMEYVKANDVANIVRNLMPRGTDIVVYEPSNMLIVTAQPAGIAKFLKLLEAIDIPATDRDAVKTFVYSVENGEARKLVDILKNIYTSKKAAGGAPVKTVSPSPAPVSQPSTPSQRAQQPSRTPAPSATVLEGLAGEIEGEILIEAYEDINAIIVKSTPRAYLVLLETIKKLDVQPKQVLIEMLIAEITLDNSSQFGVEWLIKESVKMKNRDYDFDVIGGFTTKDNANMLQYDTSRNAFSLAGAAAAAAAGATPAGAVLSHPANVFASIISPRKFDILLTAAASTGKLNVLASPHVLALDNKEAKIEIADEVPVATSITQPTTGVTSGVLNSTFTSTSQVQFKSAGTILTVTPHINDKKQVTLKISQEVSELGAIVPIGGQDYQGFKTRKANTTAIVQDGHTLVIGGIINERKGTSRSGLPILSDLPLIGYLFGSTTDTIARKELILMVTPHVISNHEEADELTRELKDRVQSIKENIEKRQKKVESTIQNMEQNRE